MSEGMNKVILLGNLGADPELRYTASGVAVLSIRLATNESYLDKNKEPQERVEWHTVLVWGPRGEGLSRVLSKGSSIAVEGTLRTSSYEKDGQKRYRTEVHAREVYFAGKRPAGLSADVDPIEGDEAQAKLPVKVRVNGFGQPRKPGEPPIDELPY